MTMPDALLSTVAATGFGVAFIHAALPTHWLPFVLAGRAQRWSAAKTVSVTALAGGGHVLFTVVLGAMVAWAGIAVDRWTEGVFPWIAGAVLIAFGALYLGRQWRGGGHGHVHFTPAGAHIHPHAGSLHPHDHDHGHSPGAHDHRSALARQPQGDTAVILGLLAALTFSPCEGFLPVFVAGVQYGWAGFALLCVILALATLAGMLLLTALTLKGLKHAAIDRFEQYENVWVGLALIALGVVVWLTEI